MKLGWNLLLCAALASFCLSAKAAEKQNILVLGDSLSAGYGLEAGNAFPELLQQKIDAAGLPFKIINAGVSGDTTAGGLRRLDWLLKRPVSVLLLELGGNDGLRGVPLAETRRNLQKIIDRTREKYPNAQVVLAGMQMPPNFGEEYVTEFKKLYPTLASENHATLIPFLLEGVGGRADLNLPDRIHPTAEGHRVVAENVWKVLEPVLRKAAAAPANARIASGKS